MESEGGRPRAVFMAFGTQGDVYPIAAIAAALACDQRQYDVILITHSAHKTLGAFLEARRVYFIPVPTPPALSFDDDGTSDDSGKVNFPVQKRAIQMEHRKECLSTIERIFGDGPSMEGDFILINFFALEGWSLAELFQIVCPFMLDQFYWAERMYWLGLAPEPLPKSNLVPENDDAMSVEHAVYALIKAIKSALSPDVKGRASEMAEKISLEDGIDAALKVLKKEVIRPRDQ